MLGNPHVKVCQVASSISADKGRSDDACQQCLRKGSLQSYKRIGGLGFIGLGCRA